MNEITKNYLIDSKILLDRRILIICTGSISIYKMLDISNFFKKCGASVKVIMTKSAKRFVSPLAFEALLHSEVLESERWAGEGNFETLPNHINYAKWAELVLIAPASANTIAKLAHGIADNLALSTLLAIPKDTPILLAPAMNTNMLNHPATQENLKILKQRNIELIPPRVSALACDTIGEGALARESEIIFFTIRTLRKKYSHKVIITGGSSSENIDDAREIANKSSGLQASSLALWAYFLGCEIIFITSKTPLTLPLSIKTISAKTVVDFQNALDEQTADYLFMTAAILDFAPETSYKGKIKKEGLDSLTLKLIKTPDILSTFSAEGMIKVGFKAEFDRQSAQRSAKNMLTKKACDFVCLNVLDGFGELKNEVEIFSKDSSILFPLDSKFNIAGRILDTIFNAR